MHRQRRFLVPAVLSGLALAAAVGPAAAQPAPFSEEPTQYRSNKPYPSDVERERRREQEEAGVVPESPWRVTGGVDFRDQYFFRGYNYVSSGVMAQPYLDIGYTVYSDPHLAVTPHGGMWMDWTQQETPDAPNHFQEFRANAGVLVKLDDFRLDFQYIFYTSPGNAFEDVHEIGVDVRYDDSRCWTGSRRGWIGPFVALNPRFSLYYELKDYRDNDYNTYVDVGLEPALRPFALGRMPLTVSFPVTLGGSYDGYYKEDDGQNSDFGYWQAGIRCVLPLGKTGYGGWWSLDAEVDYVKLIADSAEAANGHDGDDIVFRVGLAFR